jgi:hypothetical protein
MAVLIDADNTSAGHAGLLLEELARYGVPTVKRAYGDWTTQNLVRWKDELHRNAIQPVQQFAYTTGKNSTDSALIIDAMDLLYSGNLDAFAIVSSDSDFTRLATRLRESGKTVIGLGRRRTPASLVAACDRFIYLEVLEQQQDAAASPQEPTDPESAPPLPDLRAILTSAINGTSQDDGWSPLSAVGSYLGNRNASFDPRNYGFAKLTSLARAQDYVELDQTSSQPRVRLRSKQDPAPKRVAKKTATKKQGSPKKAQSG